MKRSLRTLTERGHPPRFPHKGRRARARSAAEQLAARERRQPGAAAEQPEIPASQPDLAAEKVREAGGPLDRASYACQCGYLFAASVTAAVECPNCGASQAW